MKYSIFLLMPLFFMGKSVCAQPFLIKGKIENNTSHFIYISYYSDILKKGITDSSIIANHNFQFKGEINMPTLASVKLRNTRRLENTALLFIEPGKMFVSLDAHHLTDAVLTGSFSGRVYDTLRRLRNNLIEKFQSTLDSIEGYGNNGVTPETMQRRKEYDKKRTQLDTAFLMARPTSIVTACFLLPYFSGMSKNRIVYYYNNMGEKLQKSIYGVHVSDVIELMSRASIGDEASDFKRIDVNNNTISLRQFRGRYVLLDFWASWCVPCRAESPHLIKLYKKYHVKGVEIISIADDDNHVQKWKEAIKNDGIGSWPQILRGSEKEKAINGIFNPNDLTDLYGVESLPTKILIDTAGKIIYNSKYRNNFDLDATLKNIYDNEHDE